MSLSQYMLSCIRKINASDRFFSYDAMRNTCALMEELMRELHLEQVTTEWFPSDGITDFGGWLMPLCWNPEQAVLNLVLPDGTEQKICSFADVPCSLMQYSRAADITAEMVLPDAEDVAGKIVFFPDHLVQMNETLALLKRGAAGVVCAGLQSPYQGKPGFEYLDNACQWCNYQIPFWQVPENPFGFSLSPNQGKFLMRQLRENGKVVLHAKVEAEISAGKIPVVSGLLPGETDEEIVLTGHLFEAGANDNASGAAEMLATVKELSAMPRKRGIRLMFTHECKSLQAWLNTRKNFPKMVAGLNTDMVGVSLDRTAFVGDGAPSYPTFATPLVQHFLKKHGFSAYFGQITGNDSSLCEPFFGTAILSLEFLADPNYHNSADTPDRIDPELLEDTFQTVREYVAFLVNAGLPEAKTAAQLSRDYDLARKTDAAVANQRMRSVRSLVSDPAEQQELDRFLQSLYMEEKPAVITEKSEFLRGIIPVKQFRGFFAFEKFWCHAEAQYPEQSSLFSGWSAPRWVDDAMAWADGSRTAEQILNLVNASWGKPVSAAFFSDFLRFMKENGYVSWNTAENASETL